MARLETGLNGATAARRLGTAAARKRPTVSVEAEIEWSKIARRLKRVDARTYSLMREAFLTGYIAERCRQRK
jgi:hypothetical protein